VIRLAAQKFEALLDCDSHRAAAPPQADEKIRLKPGVDYVNGELE
jgi:hypothetical protein